MFIRTSSRARDSGARQGSACGTTGRSRPRGGTRLLVATVPRMSQTARVSRSNASRNSLELVRDDFAELLDSVTEAELAAPSAGTQWTNGQLLFHMWFGQRIARTLIPVFGGFSRLPARASVVWSRVLTAFTTPYDRINYAGSVIGARITSLDALRRHMREIRTG